MKRQGFGAGKGTGIRLWGMLAATVMGLWAGLEPARAQEVLLPFYNIPAFCKLQEDSQQEACQRQEGLAFERTRIMWPGTLPYVRWTCLRDNVSESYVALQKCLTWRLNMKWTPPPGELADKNVSPAGKKTR